MNNPDIMPSNDDNIRQIIKERMIEELISNLTIGMLDNDLKEYSEDEIVNFLNKNDDKLNDSVDEMFNDYKNDDELNDILTAPNDWFREYLCTHFNLDLLYGT